MASLARNLILALAFAVASVGCSSGGDSGPGGPTDESWTIGIYMAADNNLEAEGGGRVAALEGTHHGFERNSAWRPNKPNGSRRGKEHAQLGL